MNPLETIKEKFWINVYHSDNPKAPICNLEFVSKENKDERYKYPVWKDREKAGNGYIGKLEEKKYEAKPATAREYAKASGSDFDDSKDLPF